MQPGVEASVVTHVVRAFFFPRVLPAVEHRHEVLFVDQEDGLIRGHPEVFLEGDRESWEEEDRFPSGGIDSRHFTAFWKCGHGIILSLWVWFCTGVEPPVGIEPTAVRLQGGSSASELRWRDVREG